MENFRRYLERRLRNPAIKRGYIEAATEAVCGHVRCPECGRHIPVTVVEGSLHIVDGDDGQRAWADVDLTDVWAHAWQCYAADETQAQP